MPKRLLILAAITFISCVEPTPIPGPGTEIDPEPEYPVIDPSTPGFGEYGKVSIENGSSVNALWYHNGMLFAGDDGHVHIFNLDNPLVPKEIGKATFPGKVRQIAVYGNLMHVACREGGLFIIDISNISSPQLICRYDCSELATGVDAAGDALFLGHRNNGVEFVDIADPQHPQHIDLIKTSESQSVFYQNGYLYSGEWAAGEVTVFDVRDLTDIKITEIVKLSGYGDGLWAKGNRLYVSTGHHHRNNIAKTQDGDGHGVEIWDISDPAHPKFISRAEFDLFYKSGIDYWTPRLSGDGKTLFCSDVYNGAYAVDIHDETAPIVVGRFETPEKGAVTSIVVGEGVVYVSAGKEGIFVIKSERAFPVRREIGALPSGNSFRRVYGHPSDSHFNRWQDPDRGQVHGAAGYKDAIFVACGDAGLSVLKQKSDGSLNRIAKGPSKYAGDVKVRGNKLYVAEGLEGIGIYNIASDYSLSLLKRLSGRDLGPYTSSQVCHWIMVPNEKYILCGNRIRGYMPLYNKGTDDAPNYAYTTNVSQYVGYNKYVSDKVCDGDKLPYITRNSSMWIDLSSSSVSTPQTISSSKLASALNGGVTHFKNGKALYNQNDCLKIVASGGDSPLWVSQTSSSFVGTPRWDEGNVIVLSSTINRQINVIDIKSYKDSPVSMTVSVRYSETTEGRPEAASFWKGKILVPCGYQGLLISK